MPVNAFAGRPLITNDANTRGKGKYLIQTGGEYARDHDDEKRINKTTIGIEIDYGVTENIDIVFYLHIRPSRLTITGQQAHSMA